MEDRRLGCPVISDALVFKIRHTFITATVPGMRHIFGEFVRLLREVQAFGDFSKVLVSSFRVGDKRSKVTCDKAKVRIVVSESDRASAFVAHHVHQADATVTRFNFRYIRLMLRFGDHDDQHGY